MSIGERIRCVREDLKMTRAAFGESLGVSGDVINNMERDRAEVKEYMLRLLCKVHNVNYFWLVEGKGDMYLSPPEIITNEVAEKYGLDKNDISLIEEYVNLDSDVRKAIKQLIINVVKKAPEN